MILHSTPIAVFAYNRPDHLRQLLDSLCRCVRLDECPVFIYCDGAKTSEHIDRVQSTRVVAREFAPYLNGANLIERDKNLGLARSIVEGATELCKQYGRVIVLEDDLILHPAFLDFMLQSLDRYENDTRVAQVAGFTFPIQTPTQPDAFFLPLTTSWGWATWSRAWKAYSWNAYSALSILDDPILRSRFNLNGAYPYYEMLQRTANGSVDSWAILWYFAAFHSNQLTLYPRKSLVWQNGFDESGTNIRNVVDGLQISLKDFLKTAWNRKISFPTQIEPDYIVLEKLEKFLKTKLGTSLKGKFSMSVRAKSKWLFDKIGL